MASNSQLERRTHSQGTYGILDLPDEILLQAVHFLGFRDITALRKTCTRLCMVTQDRSAWRQMLRAQSRSLPLPYHIKNPSSWTSLVSQQIETAVRRLHVVEHTWLLPRSTYLLPGHSASCAMDPVFMNEDGSRTIYSISIFLDRWLLCIYHEKLVELWDLDSVVENPHKPVLCTSQQLKGVGSFSSAVTHINEDDQVLTIAVSCHELCHVLQVQLYSSSAILRPHGGTNSQGVQFHVIAVITFASPIFYLRALDPTQSLLLLGLPSSFHLLNWNSNERTVVNMLSEEEEELWNGVVQATFLTPRHILVLKAHSLEVCTLLDGPQARMGNITPETDTDPSLQHQLPKQMSAAVHSHFFPSTTFRGVSFSRPTVHEPSPSDPAGEPTRVSLSFLAYDVLRGLFHCSVLVVIPSLHEPLNLPSHVQAHGSSPPIDVQVRLLAAHNMAIPLAPGDQASGPVSRSGFSHGTRGFVSACALGPAGRRGVWVERRRGAVRRVVYGFTAHQSEEDDDDDDDEGNHSDADSVSDSVGFEGAPPKKVVQKKGAMERRTMEGFQPGTPISVHNSELDIDPAHAHSWHTQAPRAIEGKEVYDVNSNDLQDDVTHVAFAETTGLIALGTRKGDIRILGRAG